MRSGARPRQSVTPSDWQLVYWACSRGLVIPYWGIGVPLVTFYPAVLFAAALGGFGAGILATLVLAVAAAYLFLDPIHPFRGGHTGEIFTLVLFIGLGT